MEEAEEAEGTPVTLQPLLGVTQEMQEVILGEEATLVAIPVQVMHLGVHLVVETLIRADRMEELRLRHQEDGTIKGGAIHQKSHLAMEEVEENKVVVMMTRFHFDRSLFESLSG